MRFALSAVCCLLFGVGVGWYVGQGRPDLNKQRQLLKEYQVVRTLGSESELAEVGINYQENVASLSRTNEFAAVIALRTFYKLESGDDKVAIDGLVMAIRMYYRAYRNNGADTNLILQIEGTAREFPVLAAAIAVKPE